jgi:DNA-binding transcriptional LysR family regulator
MLDLKRMLVLREVAAHGSFSAAADWLANTQSAVSQQIATLEREAGTRLVDRGPRRVRLTDAGEALVRHTEVILARMAEAEAELEAIAGLRGGRVRLVAFPSAGATLVPAAVAEFRHHHPDVEIQLTLAEPPDAIAGLREGDVDIALTIEGEDGNDSVELIHLLDDPMYVALPRCHPLAGRARIRLADLVEEQWMLGSTGRCPDRLVFMEACRAAGFEPRLAFQSDDYNAIQGFVAAGVGVALIPDLALVNVRDDILVRSPVGPAPVRRILAATTAGCARSPATRALLEALQRTAAAHVAGRRPLAA